MSYLQDNRKYLREGNSSPNGEAKGCCVEHKEAHPGTLGPAGRCRLAASWAAATTCCQQFPLNPAHLCLGWELRPLCWWHCSAEPGSSHTVAAFVACTSCATKFERETQSMQAPRQDIGESKKIWVSHCRVWSQNQAWEGFVSAVRSAGGLAAIGCPQQEVVFLSWAWCWLSCVPHSLLCAVPIQNWSPISNPEAKTRALHSGPHEQHNVVKE